MFFFPKEVLSSDISEYLPLALKFVSHISKTIETVGKAIVAPRFAAHYTKVTSFALVFA